jgi:hypothetical protein
MEWIKNNPHQLALAVCSAGLIGASAFVLLQSQGLPEKFSSATHLLDVQPKDNVKPLEMQVIQEAAKDLQSPTRWAIADEKGGPLFISKRYIVKDGKVIPPDVGGVETRYGVIPNKWLIDNGLNPFDPATAKQDPDNDGFPNEDEWKYGQTNPKDAKSFPPYHTRLYLKQYIRVPFRLKFVADDVDKKDPSKSTFQINTLDLRTPSTFLPIGETIPKTKFKLEKFEQKTAVNPKTGAEDDVSELTVLNTETGDRVVLIKNQITDSPDSFALFNYEWPEPDQAIQVKKLQQFVLRPNTQVRYKLLDIKESEALIELPSGEKFTVLRTPQEPSR